MLFYGVRKERGHAPQNEPHKNKTGLKRIMGKQVLNGKRQADHAAQGSQKIGKQGF